MSTPPTYKMDSYMYMIGPPDPNARCIQITFEYIAASKDVELHSNSEPHASMYPVLRSLSPSQANPYIPIIAPRAATIASQVSVGANETAEDEERETDKEKIVEDKEDGFFSAVLSAFSTPSSLSNAAASSHEAIAEADSRYLFPRSKKRDPMDEEVAIHGEFLRYRDSLPEGDSGDLQVLRGFAMRHAVVATEMMSKRYQARGLEALVYHTT